jgi:D-threo-aldose 1-dehydrogenase
MDITTQRPIGRTALSVTATGFGGAGIGNLYRPVPLADAQGALGLAWERGIRFFDTAPFYGFGLSERRIGDFLRDKPRDSFVLSTKVGRRLEPLKGRPAPDHGFADPLPFAPVFDYSYDGVMRSHEASLQRLGLDRVDILLIHDIGRMTHGAANDTLFRDAMGGGLKALQELKAAGDIGAYGMGVNEVEICLEALNHGEFDCFLLAGRFTLLDHAPAGKLLDLCLARQTSLLIGGVFNSGILATGPIPGAHYNYGEPPPEIVERVRRLQEICARHRVKLPTAALQFPGRHPTVATTLLGVVDAPSLARNLDGLAEAVPTALWTDLAAAGLLRKELLPYLGA